MADNLLEHIGDLPQVETQLDTDLYEIEGNDGAGNPTSNKETRLQLKNSMAASGAVPDMVETKIAASIGARDFETSHPYDKNQLIVYNGDLYRARYTFTSGSAFNVPDWEIVDPDEWGKIKGTLSDQTDLAEALDARLNKAATHANGSTVISNDDAGSGLSVVTARNDTETTFSLETNTDAGNPVIGGMTGHPAASTTTGSRRFLFVTDSNGNIRVHLRKDKPFPSQASDLSEDDLILNKGEIQAIAETLIKLVSETTQEVFSNLALKTYVDEGSGQTKAFQLLGTAIDGTEHTLIELAEYGAAQQIEIGSESIHLNLNNLGPVGGDNHITCDTHDGEGVAVKLSVAWLTDVIAQCAATLASAGAYTDDRIEQLRVDALILQAPCKESELPAGPFDPSHNGYFYQITDFDVTYPGENKKGSAVWYDSLDNYYLAVDTYNNPDEDTITKNSNGEFMVADVDTGTVIADTSGGFANNVTLGFKAFITAVIAKINGLFSLISGLNTALGGKQNTLESGTNIKTINNTSVLGPGNINVAASNFGGYRQDFLNVASGAQFTLPLTTGWSNNPRSGVLEIMASAEYSNGYAKVFIACNSGTANSYVAQVLETYQSTTQSSDHLFEVVSAAGGVLTFKVFNPDSRYSNKIHVTWDAQSDWPLTKV